MRGGNKKEAVEIIIGMMVMDDDEMRVNFNVRAICAILDYNWCYISTKNKLITHYHHQD